VVCKHCVLIDDEEMTEKKSKKTENKKTTGWRKEDAWMDRLLTEDVYQWIQ